MAISLSSLTKGGVTKPPRITIYGTEGIGKTTLAASAPNPVFLDVEDGRQSVSDSVGWKITSFDECMEALGVLYTDEHDYQTVVIDSFDWLERLIWKKVCKDENVKSIEDIGFGKGYVAAANYWVELCNGLNALRDEKGMISIRLGHSIIQRFDPPDGEPYDRYQIKLHKTASAILREHSDIVGFCNYQVSIVKTEVGFNKKVSRGAGSGMRYLFLEERPAFQAKNRYGMPEKIELKPSNGWAELEKHLPAMSEQKTAA